MTRDEFIEGYVQRSGIVEWRNAEGFLIDGRQTVALPCNCGEEGCEGWAMVRGRGVRWHLFQCTDAEVEDPMRIETDDQGLALARAFMEGLLPRNTPETTQTGVNESGISG